jgi:hypothetical protein
VSQRLDDGYKNGSVHEISVTLKELLSDIEEKSKRQRCQPHPEK